jgi:phospholipid-binding lipoprotein MlaA
MAGHSRQLFILISLLVVGQLAACATSPGSTEEKPVRSESDPWEPMNRIIYRGNRAFDSVTFKPIAKGYTKLLPTTVRRSITNFSVNLLVPRSAVNNFLQGKVKRGFDDIARFLFNTTIGIGGLFDVASAAGLEQYNENFSQTMAVWGVPEGPYLVLPFLGPQSLLDAVMLPADIRFDPLFHYDNSSVRDKLYLLRVIDLRARLLPAEKFMQESKDPYITLRESYSQVRMNKIYDGNPPEDEEMLDDFFDED